MKKRLLSLSILICPYLLWANENFALHLNAEPQSLDIAQHRGSGSSYLFSNLHRSLLNYDDDKGLVGDLAQKCTRKDKNKVVCTLDPKARWSDGSTITAEDVLRGFRYLVDPKTAAIRSDLLFAVKNAHAILKAEKKPEELGIRVTKHGEIEFELSGEDPDFEYKLASPILIPLKTTSFPSTANGDQLVVSGPYQIEKWISGQKVILKPNPFYDRGYLTRPKVEIYFIQDDNTALNLYEKGTLNFLRRLPTIHYEKYHSRNDYVELPVQRFDYVGFGSQLKDLPALRKALTLALDYKQFKKILTALGDFGCPGINEKLYDSKLKCFAFDPAEAKILLKEVKAIPPLTLYYSNQGGEDVARGVEWMQAQWKQNLGLTVNLQSFENKIYLDKLDKEAAPLFRKGVGLDQPTCLAALETFAPDSPENYIHLKSETYNKILDKLRKSNRQEQIRHCTEGLEFLFNNHELIPTGRIRFMMLASPQFTGWRLNELNTLDLSNLHRN